jgi:hypothetical protein
VPARIAERHVGGGADLGGELLDRQVEELENVAAALPDAHGLLELPPCPALLEGQPRIRRCVGRRQSSATLPARQPSAHLPLLVAAAEPEEMLRRLDDCHAGQAGYEAEPQHCRCRFTNLVPVFALRQSRLAHLPDQPGDEPDGEEEDDGDGDDRPISAPPLPIAAGLLRCRRGGAVGGFGHGKSSAG